MGLSQLETVGRLEESRLPMLWGQEQDAALLEFSKQLIAFRRQMSESLATTASVLVIG